MDLALSLMVGLCQYTEGLTNKLNESSHEHNITQSMQSVREVTQIDLQQSGSPKCNASNLEEFDKRHDNVLQQTNTIQTSAANSNVSNRGYSFATV